MSTPAADSKSIEHVEECWEDRLDGGGVWLVELNGPRRSGKVGWGGIVKYKRPLNHRSPSDTD
jgi:hypothetical protein